MGSRDIKEGGKLSAWALFNWNFALTHTAHSATAWAWG